MQDCILAELSMQMDIPGTFDPRSKTSGDTHASNLAPGNFFSLISRQPPTNDYAIRSYFSSVSEKPDCWK